LESFLLRHDRAFPIVQSAIDEFVASNGAIRLLEAGCGSMSWYDFGPNAHRSGIDLSMKQLDRNEFLDERMVGNICDHPLRRGYYDIVICWDVLEHLEDPRAALDNLFSACRPGGMIMLGFPNLLSLKGCVTKFTPHAFHVWFYRHVFGVKDAGTNDVAPFPTPFRLSIAPPAIKQFARTRRAEIQLCLLRESVTQQELRRDKPWMDILQQSVRLVTKCLTLGAVDSTHSDCVFILRPGVRGE
jgi:SAM-dependent methyltransferase